MHEVKWRVHGSDFNMTSSIRARAKGFLLDSFQFIAWGITFKQCQDIIEIE